MPKISSQNKALRGGLRAICILLLAALPLAAQSLSSPNKQIQVSVRDTTLEIRYRNKLIARAVAGGPRLAAADQPSPSKPKICRSDFRETWRPVLGKSASIENRYRQLIISSGDRDLVVPAYNDGVAFRYR